MPLGQGYRRIVLKERPKRYSIHLAKNTGESVRLVKDLYGWDYNEAYKEYLYYVDHHLELVRQGPQPYWRDQYHLHAQFREGVEVIVSQPPLPKKIPKSDPYLVWRKQCVCGVLGSSDAVLPRHPHNMVPTGTGTIKQWAIHHQA